MKILFAPVSKEVSSSEFTSIQDICVLHQPDQIRLFLPEGLDLVNLSDADKAVLEALNSAYDIAITDYNPENPGEAAKYLKQMRSDLPDAEILVNTLGGSAELQAELLKLASDESLRLILTDGAAISETEASVSEDSVIESTDDATAVAAEEPVSDAESAEPETAQPDPEAIKKDAVTEFGKAMLSEMIASYDYHGALLLSKKLGDAIPEIVPFLLEAADMRSDGRFADANQMFRRCGLEGIMTGQQSIVEYYLLLELYIKQERYTDYLRAVKPFLLEIMIAAIRKEFNMDITRYMIYGSRRWDENKLVLEQMTGKFNETFTYHTKPKPCKAGGYVTTAHLSNLMENLSVQRQHATMILDTLKLRLNEEERVKTLAFYNLQGVTAQDIEKVCACRPEDLLTMLLNYIRNYTDITVTDEMLHSYQQMNEMIESYL